MIVHLEGRLIFNVSTAEEKKLVGVSSGFGKERRESQVQESAVQ